MYIAWIMLHDGNGMPQCVAHVGYIQVNRRISSLRPNTVALAQGGGDQITPPAVHQDTDYRTSTCNTHFPAARRLQHRSLPSPYYCLSLFCLPQPVAYNQRDGPVVSMDLQSPSSCFLTMAPAARAAGLRRRGRGCVRFIVLPQVIECTQDPCNGQNCNGVGPYPAHCEPIWRATDTSPNICVLDTKRERCVQKVLPG